MNAVNVKEAVSKASDGLLLASYRNEWQVSQAVAGMKPERPGCRSLRQAPLRVAAATLVADLPDVDEMAQLVVDERQPLRIGQSCGQRAGESPGQFFGRNGLVFADRFDDLSGAVGTG